MFVCVCVCTLSILSHVTIVFLWTTVGVMYSNSQAELGARQWSNLAAHQQRHIPVEFLNSFDEWQGWWNWFENSNFDIVTTFSFKLCSLPSAFLTTNVWHGIRVDRITMMCGFFHRQWQSLWKWPCFCSHLCTVRPVLLSCICRLD